MSTHIKTTYDDAFAAAPREIRQSGRGVCGCYRGVLREVITAPDVDLARGYRENVAITVILTVINVWRKSAASSPSVSFK